MNQDNFLWGLQITDGLTMELVSQMTVIAFGVGVICFYLQPSIQLSLSRSQPAVKPE